MQKISPCLWFDNNAEEAVKFYVRSLKILRSVTLLTMARKAMRFIKERGTVMTIDFEIEGQNFWL